MNTPTNVSNSIPWSPLGDNGQSNIPSNIEYTEQSVNTILVAQSEDWGKAIENPEVEWIKKVTYKDLLNIGTIENQEPFIAVGDIWILSWYMEGMSDMKAVFWDKIIVRKTVSDMLLRADNNLKSVNPNFSLFITYGYRSLEVQTKKFLDILRTKTEEFFPDPHDLYEEVHKSIAVPSVAGHPTWWAVDVLIYDSEQREFLDFWTQIYNFSLEDWCSILNTSIPKKSYDNRMLLHAIMTEVGFAPYYGEYWHFSYGDKEWAFYYDTRHSIYEQKSIFSLKRVF